MYQLAYRFDYKWYMKLKDNQNLSEGVQKIIFQKKKNYWQFSLWNYDTENHTENLE